MTEQQQSDALGEAFAQAVAAKDHDRVLELLHPELDFRAMTPGRVWEAESPQDVVDALREWFDDSDVIEGFDTATSTDRFADRERIGYRLRVRTPDGLHLVDQQAYLSARDGRIGWLRIMCAGMRPVDG
jgi:hypothetical protein